MVLLVVDTQKGCFNELLYDMQLSIFGRKMRGYARQFFV